VRKKLVRKHEVLDKVFGLRMTGTLWWLLKQKDKREGHRTQTLEDSLLPTLFPQEMSRMVFPFLVGEAKSESGPPFHAVHRQAAIIIHESLLIQDHLRRATGTMKRVAGPLVWYFSNAGPRWQVSAGYMPEGRKHVKTVRSLP
jgi:hypothetical protein